MLTKLLPATWVRYPVRIGAAYRRKSVGPQTWEAPVRIGPPGIGRSLMDPLSEDLGVVVRCDNGDWCDSVWVRGDVNEEALTASHSTRAKIVLLTAGSNGGSVYVADTYLQEEWRVSSDGPHILEVKIVRLIDGKTADSKVFRFHTNDGVVDGVVESLS